MITIKSEKEIDYMAQAGKITAMALEAVAKAIKPGVSTYELDAIARDLIESHNAIPAFLNYHGYPNSICASINEEIVHGIPSQERILQEGDIISIDIGAIYNGYVGDMANTYPVGQITEQAQKLIDVTRESFYAGFEMCREGNRLFDVSHAIQTVAESNHFSVVREYVGHGIGSSMHEDPAVPNYGTPGKGVRLRKGMTLAIEPMVNVGTYKTKLMTDNWTVTTADGELSAHYEHTIVITDDQPRILTSL